MLQSPSGLNVVADSLLFICLSHFWHARHPLPPHPPSSSPSSSLLSLFSFHVSSFCSSQSHPALLSRLGSRLPLPSLVFALRATGATSSAAAPVAFTSLAAPSRLLSRFLFISVSVCLSIPMIVYLPPSSVASPYYTHASESVFLIYWPSVGHIGVAEVSSD